MAVWQGCKALDGSNQRVKYVGDCIRVPFIYRWFNVWTCLWLQTHFWFVPHLSFIVSSLVFPVFPKMRAFQWVTLVDIHTSHVEDFIWRILIFIWASSIIISNNFFKSNTHPLCKFWFYLHKWCICNSYQLGLSTKVHTLLIENFESFAHGECECFLH